MRLGPQVKGLHLLQGFLKSDGACSLTPEQTLSSGNTWASTFQATCWVNPHWPTRAASASSPMWYRWPPLPYLLPLSGGSWLPTLNWTWLSRLDTSELPLLPLYSPNLQPHPHHHFFLRLIFFLPLSPYSQAEGRNQSLTWWDPGW